MPTINKDNQLKNDQYYAVETKKNTIYLHHTAGSHFPINTINGWASDALGRIATAYVIGGKGPDGNTTYDGKIYQAFDPKYWAHHLGLTAGNNTILNQQSIAIENCSFGPATKGADGKFYNYVNQVLATNSVYDLGYIWKGKQYYQKYTDTQIAAIKELIVWLGKQFSIDIRKGLPALLRDYTSFPVNGTVLQKQVWLNKYGVADYEGHSLGEDGAIGARTQSAIDKVTAAIGGKVGELFSLNSLALNGKPGLWTHVNVRTDKYDCWPQPEFIAMLKSL